MVYDGAWDGHREVQKGLFVKLDEGLRMDNKKEKEREAYLEACRAAPESD